MSNNQTILITGGCGFVGRHLVNHLLENNLYQKIVVCCYHEQINQILFKKSNRLFFAKADLLQPEKYKAVLAKHKPDDIIHLAAIARFRQGEENPEDTVKANFFGTVKLLQFAQQVNVKRFLYVSSNLARNPKGVTGSTKYLVEAYIKNLTTPPDVFSIRLPNVIDSPGAVTLIFKHQIEEGKAITLTDQRMTRKFITPEQSAKDLLFALNNCHHRDIYINNKPSTPIMELAQKMILDSGKNIPVKFIGMRPGEKLEEENYPAHTIANTAHQDIFILTEHQHTAESIHQAINLLNKKAKPETIDKIKALFKMQ